MGEGMAPSHEYNASGEVKGHEVYFYNDDYDDDGYYDDDGFLNYEEKTVDPSPWALILTTAVSVLIIALIPVCVCLGERLKARRKRRRQLNKNIQTSWPKYPNPLQDTFEKEEKEKKEDKDVEQPRAMNESAQDQTFVNSSMAATTSFFGSVGRSSRSLISDMSDDVAPQGSEHSENVSLLDEGSESGSLEAAPNDPKGYYLKENEKEPCSLVDAPGSSPTDQKSLVSVSAPLMIFPLNEDAPRQLEPPEGRNVQTFVATVENTSRGPSKSDSDGSDDDLLDAGYLPQNLSHGKPVIVGSPENILDEGYLPSTLSPIRPDAINKTHRRQVSDSFMEHRGHKRQPSDTLSERSNYRRHNDQDQPSVAGSRASSKASSKAASVFSFAGLAALQQVVDEYVSSAETWHPKERQQRRVQGAAQAVQTLFHGNATEFVDAVADVDPSDTSSEENIAKKDEGTQSNMSSVGIQSSFNFQTVRGLKRFKFYRCDADMKGLIKLALPFTIHTFIIHGFELMEVAVIGRLIGTAELSALFIVDLVFSLSTMFMEGAFTGLFTLCSQSIGANEHYLAGQYVQIAIIFYQGLFLPFIVIWWFLMDDVVRLFGFDQEVADIAVGYSQILFLTYLVQPYGEGLDYILEVTGYEVYTAAFSIVEQGTHFAAFFLYAKYGNPSLRDLAVLGLALDVLSTMLFVVMVWSCGWLQRQAWAGMVGNFALSNGEAVRVFLKTSLPLSFGYVLMTGEWELLTFFVGAMGPAEVAAWGLLGYIWEAIEEVSLALADAAEVQVGKMLGSGQPFRARSIANKALYVGVLISLIFSIPVIALKDILPRFFTKDETLQRMLSELLPFIGIGNMALMFGSMCWTILGAQGRYALATTMSFLGSWFVTIPLCAVFTFVLDFNLESITGAVVIGYAFSGAINASFLLRSNWKKLSSNVINDVNKGAGNIDSSSLAQIDYDDFDWDELPPSGTFWS